MPKGPNGEKRPADVIGNAVHIMRIATGEVEDTTPASTTSTAASLGRKGGLARAAATPKAKRTEIAKKAASARWRANPARAEEE